MKRIAVFILMLIVANSCQMNSGSDNVMPHKTPIQLELEVLNAAKVSRDLLRYSSIKTRYNLNSLSKSRLSSINTGKKEFIDDNVRIYLEDIGIQNGNETAKRSEEMYKTPFFSNYANGMTINSGSTNEMVGKNTLKTNKMYLYRYADDFQKHVVEKVEKYDKVHKGNKYDNMIKQKCYLS